MKQVIIRNTLWSGFYTSIIGVVGFLLLPFMIHRIGAVEYGLVAMSYIFRMSGYVSLLELGFQSSISRYVAEYHGKRQTERISQLVNSMLVIFFLIGIAASALGLTMASWIVTRMLIVPELHQNSFQIALLLLFGSYIFQFPNLVFLALFEGLQRFDILKGVQLATFILEAIGIIILLLAGKSYQEVIILSIVVLALQFVVFTYLASRQRHFFRFGWSYFSLIRVREIMRLTKFVFIGRLTSLTTHSIGPILIGMLLGPRFLTYYEIVMRLPRFLKNALGFLNSAVMPASSYISAGNKQEKLQNLYLLGMRYSLLASVPVVSVAIFFASPFLNIWVGEEYILLAPELRIALIWVLAATFTGLGGSILLGKNRKMKELTILVVITGVIHFITAVIFVTRYQVLAVVAGLAGSLCIMLPFFMKIYLYELDIRLSVFLRELVSITVPIFPTWVIIFIITRIIGTESIISLLINATLWCALYLTTYSIFFLRESDRDILRTVLSPILARARALTRVK